MHEMYHEINELCQAKPTARLLGVFADRQALHEALEREAKVSEALVQLGGLAVYMSFDVERYAADLEASGDLYTASLSDESVAAFVEL